MVALPECSNDLSTSNVVLKFVSTSFDAPFLPRHTLEDVVTMPYKKQCIFGGRCVGKLIALFFALDEFSILGKKYNLN